MGWKTFNDRMALIFGIGLPVMWMLGRWLPIPEQVMGATVLAWGYVVQFYFRRKEPTE